jgi:acetate kinase
MNVLVLNAGSSSLKFQVVTTDLERIRRDADERLCRGYVERIGGEAIITIETRNGPRRAAPRLAKQPRQRLRRGAIGPEGASRGVAMVRGMPGA